MQPLEGTLKIHSGEKSNKCNQCDFTSSETGNLRAHFKTHSAEKKGNTLFWQFKS